MPFYKTENEKISDVVIANSTKIWSANNGKLIPATDYERSIHNEGKVAAIVRLSINKVMSETGE
ncbi:hypothetical protein [Alteromonas gracilis]|uniref:hypothetical protein n=1 Tax=Alteromonas gracilis TaxID=1479524 RepID=UPI00373530D5